AASGVTASSIDFCLAACTPQTWYSDSDHDGHGDPASGQSSCTQPAGTVAGGDDCDDTDPSIHPGAAETCNNKDDDCDGQTDEGNPGGGVACNTGQLGVCSAGTQTCQGGSIQCVRNVNPAAEACDSADNDCDGLAD